MHIGQRIATKRKERGLTALQLARRVKRDPQTISRWERGLSVPDANDLQRIADALGCSVGDLFVTPEDRRARGASGRCQTEAFV